MRCRLPVILVLASLGLSGAVRAATPPNCGEPMVERITYDWKLAGALSWVAAIAFPTSGTAELETAVNRPATRADSRLMIRDEKRTGYFLYRTTLEVPRQRTLESQHGYSWSGRTKIETAEFDYENKRVKLSEEDTRDGPSTSVEPLPAGDLRDVLTSIWRLRQRAGAIRSTERMEIFSDGKMYPVQVVALGAQNIEVAGASRRALAFRIVAAPEQARKWPGGISVWLSDDAARTPLRIDIKRSVANLRLTMTGAPVCESKK